MPIIDSVGEIVYYWAMEIPFHKDQQAEIMAALGSVVPVLLREAVDEGFHAYKVSRALDPVGHAEYGACSRANMLYDRIASTGRELVRLAADEMPELTSSIHPNKRSTEILLDPYFAFRIKRTKENRKGLTTSVSTKRQNRIKAEFIPAAQMSIDFPGYASPPSEDRLWLTVGFDLDELEEHLTKVAIGVETKKRFLWKQSLLEAEAEIIASFPTILADRINEMRTRRSA
ncbi:hypothetical protein [Humisphaera borealis]|uniref:Uncharacterized protein n=1 Tax=Humisphaera borealis TaxID=2807512 RepID=A0A7M2WSR9_9BACT|nr:hypothetical protein [Humisphaera borealis]QOV88547.1 hypothetical protein IPV69_20220 [Humisphaera borealis]